MASRVVAASRWTLLAATAAMAVGAKGLRSTASPLRRTMRIGTVARALMVLALLAAVMAGLYWGGLLS